MSLLRRRPWGLLLASALLALPARAAFAQSTHTPSAWFEGKRPDMVPELSTELVDPTGLSRFHLVTRATFTDGSKVFSSNTVWSFEARAHIRVIEGLALHAVLP